MPTYEKLDLGERPSEAKPGRAWRAATGPGRPVTFGEAVLLAERAMADADMAVLKFQELEFGWVLVLQGRRYIETRELRDQFVGHGVTIVDRQTGDVYCSGSATPAWDAVLGYLEARDHAPPISLILQDGAMAMDGGSIYLHASSGGRKIGLLLDWSSESRGLGRPQLSVDDVAIERGSAEEAAWIQSIEGAQLEGESDPVAGDRVSPPVLSIGGDISRYLSAIRSGPRAALGELARRFVEIVRSPAYQEPPPRIMPPTPADRMERIRALAAQGKHLEAALAYRHEFPEVSPAAALKFVKGLPERT